MRRSVSATSPTSASFRILPVSNNVHVEALTKDELECPRCFPQCAAEILSLIRVSIVVVSGTRKRASARHISAIPSCDVKPYSERNDDMIRGELESRTVVTSSVARWLALRR